MPVEPTFTLSDKPRAPAAPPADLASRKDLAAAAALQQRLLPPRSSRVGHYALTYQIWPSAPLSGDFVDIVELPDGTVVFLVADVAGHGTSAAMMTMVLKSFMSRLVNSVNLEKPAVASRPAEILTSLNRELVALDTDRHVCALLGCVIKDSETVWIAGAGADPQPWLVQPRSDNPVQTLAVSGKALGLFDELDLAAQAVTLTPGDALVVATDGVLELMGPGTAGEKRDRLEAAVAQSLGLPVWDALDAPSHNDYPDDVTWLRLERLE